MSKARDLSNLINTLENIMPQGKQIDFDAPYIYKGKAAPGSLTSAAAWEIQRIEKVGGGDGATDYSYTYATVSGGVPSKANIWDNRAGFTYT